MMKYILPTDKEIEAEAEIRYPVKTHNNPSESPYVNSQKTFLHGVQWVINKVPNEMKLRKVMFKKWIPREEIGKGAFKRQKEGTNCWEKDFTNEGLFHQWGCSYEEFESGAGNFTVAIVELTDGTIEQVLPINLKFVP